MGTNENEKRNDMEMFDGRENDNEEGNDDEVENEEMEEDASVSSNKYDAISTYNDWNKRRGKEKEKTETNHAADWRNWRY